MAKDLNDLDVAVVAGHGELKAVSVHEGYAELRAADHDAVVEGLTDFTRPPVAAVGRDAFLKQWSGAATKAKRLGASTSLLALAACGAGSGGKNYYHVTGALAETVNGREANDTINIDADLLGDNQLLTLQGESTMIVNNLIGDISASTLTGDLAVTLPAGGAPSRVDVVAGSGNDTVTGSNSADQLYLTSVETVNALDGNDTIYMLNASLRSADLGGGDDYLSLGNATASTTATVIGGSGLDTVNGSAAGDTLTLTSVETVNGGNGADSYIVTDEDLEAARLSGGNDTLTFADGGGLAAASSLDGGAGTDTLNVTLSQNISYTASNNITNFENLSILDAGNSDGGFDVSIILNGSFNNNVGIHFDAAQLDAGEALTLDAQNYSALHEVSVTAGAGADVITTAEANAQRGLMTVDFSYAAGDATHGGVDTLLIRDAAWDVSGISYSSNTTQTFVNNFSADANATHFGVAVLGFKAGANGDQIDVEYGSNTTTNGDLRPSYVLTTGMSLSGLSTGAVIEISSGSYQLNSNSSWSLADVAAVLSNNGNGDALVGLHDGEYTVAIYSNTSTTADAHLFSIRVDGGDGLDFSQIINQGGDMDSIEYIGVLREVGADALVASNFI